MEIKTCEQYVLERLAKLEDENKHLKDNLMVLQADLNSTNEFVEIIRKAATISATNDAKYSRVNMTVSAILDPDKYMYVIRFLGLDKLEGFQWPIEIQARIDRGELD